MSREANFNRQCSGKTGEEPPRVVNPGQGLELNITNQFETYFIADFNVTNFSNDYGDITHFAIWVREIDDQENIENLPTKPGKTPKRWSSVRIYLILKWAERKSVLNFFLFLTCKIIGNEDNNCNTFFRSFYIVCFYMKI